MLAWRGDDMADLARKGAAITATFLIQALLFVVLTRIMPLQTVPRPRIIYLPLTSMPARIRSKPRAPKSETKKHPGTAITPTPATPVAPHAVQPDARQLEGLHALLFDCGPDQILTDEEHKRCESVTGTAKPDVAAGMRIGPERSRDAAHWARGLARKQAPTLLPCMPPTLASLFCLGQAAVDGRFDLDAQPGYFDAQKPQHLPNGGDPPSTIHFVDH